MVPNLADLDSFGYIYLFSVSKKVWNSKIQLPDQKLWLPEVWNAAISMSSQFSWYLDCFNSDFEPWIVIQMGIEQSSQWHWFQPISVAESKLGFLGLPEIDFGSNLVKVVKKLWKAQVWSKTMRKKNCESLDHVWPSVKPRADQGHFGHFS